METLWLMVHHLSSSSSLFIIFSVIHLFKITLLCALIVKLFAKNRYALMMYFLCSSSASALYINALKIRIYKMLINLNVLVNELR